LNDLEKKVLKALNLELTFYHRYADYIVMAAPSEHINHIINTFNSFHECLQFREGLKGKRIDV